MTIHGAAAGLLLCSAGSRGDASLRPVSRLAFVQASDDRGWCYQGSATVADVQCILTSTPRMEIRFVRLKETHLVLWFITLAAVDQHLANQGTSVACSFDRNCEKLAWSLMRFTRLG